MKFSLLVIIPITLRVINVINDRGVVKIMIVKMMLMILMINISLMTKSVLLIITVRVMISIF